VRLAAPRLAALPGLDVVEAGAPINAAHLFADVDAAIVVDAVRTSDGRRAPGELVRLELGDERLPTNVGSSLSSHGFGVGEAIALAAALGDLPPVVVLGIEAGGTTEGTGMSPPVGAALDALADLIATEAERLSSP
jgi:hydrogenase maturation protease